MNKFENHKMQKIYKIKQTDSQFEFLEWEGLDKVIVNSLKNCWCLATMHHGIFLGKIENGVLRWLGESSEKPTSNDWKEDHLLELRLFNQAQEYYFWRNEAGRFTGRKRTDFQGSTVKTIDTNQYVRGTISRKLFKELKTNELSSIFISIRNYLGVNEIGQMIYVDSRLLDFKLKEK